MLGRKNKLKIAKNKKAKASTALVSLCVNFINNYKGSIAHLFFTSSSGNLHPGTFCIYNKNLCASFKPITYFSIGTQKNLMGLS